MATGHRGRNRCLGWVLLLGAGVLMAASLVSQAGAAQYREKVLHRFCPQGGTICGDGANPATGLIMDAQGNLYGTTNGGGGRKDGGAVFELTPDETRATGWRETVLYRFCRQANCADGVYPDAGLIMDGAGNLYGTTEYAGINGRGAVFELTPNATWTAWTETVLYTFCAQANCADGDGPNAVIMDGAGNLYGATYFGGGRKFPGVVFELTPNAAGTAWTETVLHRFCAEANCADGSNPDAGLIMDGAGNLYGTTSRGGIKDGGVGVVFELRPNAAGTAWTETVLHRFCLRANCSDGAGPAGLIMDGAGNLYGTTNLGAGINDPGVVFELRPNAIGTAWTETVLHRFCSRANCSDGAGPADLIMDGAGNLYGTTEAGGDSSSTCGFKGFRSCGVVFELMPQVTGTAWTETVLRRFCSRANCTDGANPDAGLIMDGAGNLYGTTYGGGINNHGVTFELVKLP